MVNGSSRAVVVVVLVLVCLLPVLAGDAAGETGATLRLGAGVVVDGEPMPAAALEMPASGRLFIAQADVRWTRALQKRVETAGCEAIAFIPDNAYLVRCQSSAVAADLTSLPSIARVEPFECSWRIAPELASWLADASSSADEVRRVRAVLARPGEKHALADAAVAVGGSFGTTDGDGSVIDLWVTREQLRVIACDDHLQYVGAWHPPETYMDIVREDSGADFIAQPGVGSYCGTGVRAEILDSAFDTDHPEFSGRMDLHGPVDTGFHGTSTFGIVFAAGSGVAEATGLLPCGEGIAADFDEVTCGGCDRFAFTEESKNTYEASFQSNSWGTGSGVSYTVDSWELDELIWRLDMAIFQAMNNNGNLGNPQDAATLAWSKNAVSVGGVHHENTLDTADDWWCDHDCATLHGTSSACNADPHCDWSSGQCEDDYICGTVGPAEDGRLKPDLSYFIDNIHTTTWNNAYTTGFTGTSAATPEVAGALGLILEMWADAASGSNPWGRAPLGTTVFERQPHAATMKALLINAGRSWDFTGSAGDLTRMHQGWGRPDVRAAFERAPGSLVIDEDLPLVQDEAWSWSLEVAPGADEMRATVVWLDPPKALAAAGKELINDLDLKLISPPDALGDVSVYCGNAGLFDGVESAVLWSGPPEQVPACDDPGLDASRDSVNNVENVFVAEDTPGGGIAAGTWTVEIGAYEILTDGNPDETCRGVDLDGSFPELVCTTRGCEWDAVNEVCGDGTWDVVFGLVVTGAVRLGPDSTSGLRVGKNGDGTLTLEWEPDCGGTVAHGVYRGDLDVGYGSIALESGFCGAPGTSAIIPEGAGTADFFLVVPNDGVAEGGYGPDRDPAPSGCFPSQPSPCK